MERDGLKALLDGIQHALMSGDLGGLSRFFTFPLVVYSTAGVSVMRGEADFERLAVQYRSALMDLAVVQSEAEVVSRDPPKNNRFRAIVRVNDMDLSGRVVTGSLIRYFVVQSGEAMSVEMLEYLESPLPSGVVETIVH